LIPPTLFSAIGNNDFQVLWEDSERFFCKGPRHANADNSAVLAVLPAAEHPTPVTLDRLAHEYGLKDELDAARAARPLELICEGGRTILVLEDANGEPLDRLLGAPMETGSFLRLATSIAVALGKPHRCGLIHKDLKPTNILANHTTGEVKFTEFGLASRLTRERQSPEPPESGGGPLPNCRWLRTRSSAPPVGLGDAAPGFPLGEHDIPSRSSSRHDFLLRPAQAPTFRCGQGRR
jgi:serine/threonine protein kinase